MSLKHLFVEEMKKLANTRKVLLKPTNKLCNIVQFMLNFHLRNFKYLFKKNVASGGLHLLFHRL